MFEEPRLIIKAHCKVAEVPWLPPKQTYQATRVGIEFPKRFVSAKALGIPENLEQAAMELTASEPMSKRQILKRLKVAEREQRQKQQQQQRQGKSGKR